MPPYSSATQSMATASSSTISSNMSFQHSVTSIDSRKSRKNISYPHSSPVTDLPECAGSPNMLTREVRYLCATLLPQSETRLLPAGTVLLQSFGQERHLSAHSKDEVTRHCSELFIVLTREILLKDAIGVEELEEPCKLLDLTFRDILFKSGAFDMSTTSNLNEKTSLKVARAETQELKQFTSVLRALCSVADAFEAVLNTIPTLAVSDKVPQEHRHASLGSSVVKGPTVNQYRKILRQKLAQAQLLRGLPVLKVPSRQVAHIIPSSDSQESISVAAKNGVEGDKWRAPQSITSIEKGSKVDEGNSVNSNGWSRSTLTIGKQTGLPRRLLSFSTTIMGKK